MSLNIKNEEAHRIAAELARVRGTTVTRAVTEALRNELEREKRLRRAKPLAAQLLEIGRRCAAHMKEPVSSGAHAEILYDSVGLPR